MSTTIRLGEETKAELDSLKMIPDETYESLIKRLIAFFKKAKKGEA
jgi:predicted transcriptional regulator